MDATRLEILKLQAAQSQLWATYWLHFAKSPASYARNIMRGGGGGAQLTDDEKEDEAIETALAHIRRHQEIIETIQYDR